jgi:hypothetical protein
MDHTQLQGQQNAAAPTSIVSKGLALAALLICGGCDHPQPAPARVGSSVAPITTEIVSAEPGQIELSDPQVTFSPPNLVRFEVKYRFTQGRPSKYYLCEVAFPGTENQGAKPMESWELQPEGMIKDGIVIHKPPVAMYEIRVSEADSPQNGYKLISNVVSGTIVHSVQPANQPAK